MQGWIVNIQTSQMIFRSHRSSLRLLAFHLNTWVSRVDITSHTVLMPATGATTIPCTFMLYLYLSCLTVYSDFKTTVASVFCHTGTCVVILASHCVEKAIKYCVVTVMVLYVCCFEESVAYELFKPPGHVCTVSGTVVIECCNGLQMIQPAVK